MNSLDPEILKWFFEIRGGERTVERISKTLERVSLQMEKFWMVEWCPGMSLFCRFLDLYV
jgi:hypothetical protein